MWNMSPIKCIIGLKQLRMPFQLTVPKFEHEEHTEHVFFLNVELRHLYTSLFYFSSVGLEDPADIIRDLKQAIEKAAQVTKEEKATDCI